MNDSTRRTIRTVFQGTIAVAAFLPEFIESSGIEKAIPESAGIVIVAGLITRAMANPTVERLLPSWLRANDKA